MIYRVTALSANILYLDSLGTEGVNLRGRMFYMKMSLSYSHFSTGYKNVRPRSGQNPRRLPPSAAGGSLLFRA